MKLVIENQADRLYVLSNLIRLRQALPAGVVVIDGGLEVILRKHSPLASDPMPLPATLPHPAADPPENATNSTLPQTAQG
jgi:hypothetical protein